jgi:hypothetical protein
VPESLPPNGHRAFVLVADETGFEALARQLVGAGVEADGVELLRLLRQAPQASSGFGMPEDDTSLGHGVDSVRRHV